MLLPYFASPLFYFLRYWGKVDSASCLKYFVPHLCESVLPVKEYVCWWLISVPFASWCLRLTSHFIFPSMLRLDRSAASADAIFPHPSSFHEDFYSMHQWTGYWNLLEMESYDSCLTSAINLMLAFPPLFLFNLLSAPSLPVYAGCRSMHCSPSALRCPPTSEFERISLL